MTWKKSVSLYFMVFLYISAGANHFLNPDVYIKIMPDWLPYPQQLVFVSGICEVVLGLLLLCNKTRRLAAWGIIALLVAVFPANIQMAINYFISDNDLLWGAIVRLPLQLILIWWAYGLTKKSVLVNKI